MGWIELGVTFVQMAVRPSESIELARLAAEHERGSKRAYCVRWHASLAATARGVMLLVFAIPLGLPHLAAHLQHTSDGVRRMVAGLVLTTLLFPFHIRAAVGLAVMLAPGRFLGTAAGELWEDAAGSTFKRVVLLLFSAMTMAGAGLLMWAPGAVP